MDSSDDIDDKLAPSYYSDDSETSNDDSEICVNDEEPANDSDSLQSQHSRSGPNVLDPVDDGRGGDGTRRKGFDTDYAQ